MSTLRGKVAVVTGAGSGIGRALALELARRGARLALSDVNEAGLAETVAQVGALGADVHAAPLDVSDREAFGTYARSVIGRFGVAHQLYNNAGIGGGGGSLVDADYASIDRVIGINLWGVIHGTKEFLPHLIASGDGHLVNISSLNGIMGQAGLSAYCASKFAVRGFTESVRAEMVMAGHPVQVTVVHPGGVKTNIATAALAAASQLTPAEREEQERRVRVYNEKLFKTSATQAATTILDGVEAGRTRILVGSDAKGVDLAIRLLPSHYTRLVVWWERRTFGGQ